MTVRVALPRRGGKGRAWGWERPGARRAGGPSPEGRLTAAAHTPSPGLFHVEGERSPRLLHLTIVAVFALLLFARPALAAAPAFPPLTGRVVDAAHVLDAATVEAITARSQSLEQSTGRQLVVATVPTLGGLDVQDYGYQLGRAWKIGQAGKNTGVILVVAPTEKKVGIEVGYGLEATLTDALSSLILQERILPKFRAGDVNGGVLDGANAIADQLALPDDQARQANSQAASDAARPQRHSRSGGAPGVVGLLIFFFVLSSIFRGRRGGRGGGLGWLPWVALGALGSGGRDDDWGGGGGGFGGGGGGGFSGGGGSFGGGGASGSW